MRNPAGSTPGKPSPRVGRRHTGARQSLTLKIYVASCLCQLPRNTKRVRQGQGALEMWEYREPSSHLRPTRVSPHVVRRLQFTCRPNMKLPARLARKIPEHRDSGQKSSPHHTSEPRCVRQDVDELQRQSKGKSGRLGKFAFTNDAAYARQCGYRCTGRSSRALAKRTAARAVEMCEIERQRSWQVGFLDFTP